MQTDGKNIKADGKKKYDEEAENMVAGIWVCVCALLFIASFLHCFYQWKEEGGGGGNPPDQRQRVKLKEMSSLPIKKTPH